MADAVEIRITASNGASSTFRAIQSDADKLGKSLTDAGRDGDKAFDQIERGAKDAERSVRSMGDRVQGAADTIDGMAVGLTALGGALVYAGRSAMEQERQIIALRNAWGDAADEMLDFAEQMDSVTIFSDDDIRAGERFFVTLRENYGLTIEEIQRLMQTTADLAAGAGVSYEDASSRVVAAIRGEAEAAEYLGLTMNQQAIDRENLTLTMSNEEAARYRLNALYQQAATYEGTAADVANSSIGTYAELTDKLQDTAQAAGDIIGPWGSVVSGLGLGLAGVTSLVGGLGRMTTAMRTSAVAARAMQLALAPLTWWAVGGVALGAAAYKVWESFEEGRSISEDLAAALDEIQSGDVIGFFRTLALGADDASEAMTDFTDALFTIWNEAAKQSALGNEAVAQNLQNMVQGVYGVEQAANDFVNSTDLHTRALQENLTTGEQVADAEERLRQEYTLTNQEQLARADALNAIAKAYLDPATNAAALTSEINTLNAQYEAGTITLDEHTIGLAQIASKYGDLPGVIDPATDSMGEFVASTTGVVSGAEALLSIFGDLATGIPTTTEQIESMAKSTDKLTVSVTEGADALASVFGGPTPYLNDAATQIAEITENAGTAAEKLGGMGERGAESATEMADALARTNEALQEIGGSGAEGFDALLDAAKDAERAFIADALAVGHLDDALSQINLTSLATDASRLAENIGTAGDALDNTFRIIVDNTNAIAQQVQGVEDWALELINVQGEYGKIDDLLASGAITLEQYNAAQQAQIEISAANAQVQEDILAIQAQQAPLIADLTTQQAAYVEELSKQPQQQQLIALGWMDANTAAEANQAIMLASATAAGEYGEAGYAMTQQMIQGAVAANPVLGEMLEQMGLISIGADGTITINYGSVEGAKSEIEQLNDSILMLVDLFDDGEINGSVNIETGDAQAGIEAVGAGIGAIDGTEANLRVLADNSDAQTAITATAIARDDLDGTSATTYQYGENSDAQTDIQNVATALGGLDGSTATVYINAVNNAGGVIGSVANALLNLDGASATAYVNTVNTTTYRTVGVQMANGGTVWADQPPSRWGGLAAANGRTVMVGEAGPELVTLPHGAQVMPHAASMSRVGEANGGITVQFNGDLIGTSRELMNQWAEHDFIPQITKALSDRQRAYGEAGR